ncbi:MAG: sulfite exporter TauE/SafE family protein [Flavobacteriaceae bacterium]|nr:sulfite exporter TauE/SafE family protein [Flavobacteriaceae bacterium]
MEVILVSAVAFGAAMLTFFSGFGLGTILLPVFALFFPVEIAIAMTAIVHLINNVFKLFLIWNHIDKSIVARFAVTAAIFAFSGAFVLKIMSADSLFYTIELFTFKFNVTLLKLIIGFLMIIFAIVELNKQLQNITFPKKYLPLGGALSGFFGGLSGHQGALRSMFLIRSGLTKEAFIATGIATAVIIDISRLTVYGTSFFTKHTSLIMHPQATQIIVFACLSAFLGSFLGQKLLKKVTLEIVNKVVGLMILLTAFLLIFGII